MNSTTEPCQWCGALHAGVCLRVKSFEYHENGLLKRVEFHDPARRGVAEGAERVLAIGKRLVEEEQRKAGTRTAVELMAECGKFYTVGEDRWCDTASHSWKLVGDCYVRQD